MRQLSIVAIVLGLEACSVAKMSRVEVSHRPIRTQVSQVALAEAVLLQDLMDLEGSDPFRSGVYVGNLVFSGGFITEQHDVGLQNVSKNVAYEAEELYRAQVVALVGDMMGDALDTHRQVTWQPTTLPLALLPPQTFRPVRGTHEEDGSDNVCLPRFDLEPTPLPAEVLGSLPPGIDAVIIPLVVLYYTHNGGWFLGQTYGNSAGARIRVMTVTYDAKSGAPMGHMDVTTRFLHEEVFQPNSGQLEDFAMFSERALEKRIRRLLLD
jgi:hypothetical protein